MFESVEPSFLAISLGLISVADGDVPFLVSVACFADPGCQMFTNISEHQAQASTTVSSGWK